MRWASVVALLASSLCSGQGQSEYQIPLQKLNSSFALPTMAACDGVLYVAYRSFNWLRFSSELQVLACDLASRKQLRHVTLSIPKVHGARAAEGLFLSKDGSTLAYVELYDPQLVLLLSAKDLSEVRRSTALPFTSADQRWTFEGFEDDDLLLFASGKADGLRLIRVNASSLNVFGDARISVPHDDVFGQMIWAPAVRRVWICAGSTRGVQWQEYSEDGHATGPASGYRREINNGAVALGEGKLLAFYGNMVDAGTAVRYNDHHAQELHLPCLPRPYGESNDPDYAGAICTTSPDREPEHGGDKILSSEFLLLKTSGPEVVWSRKMAGLGVANGTGPDDGFQGGDPLIYRSGANLWIVAPTRSRGLAVDELPLP